MPEQAYAARGRFRSVRAARGPVAQVVRAHA